MSIVMWIFLHVDVGPWPGDAKPFKKFQITRHLSVENGDCAEIVQNGAVAENNLPISMRVWAPCFIKTHLQVFLRPLGPIRRLWRCFFPEIFGQNEHFFVLPWHHEAEGLGIWKWHIVIDMSGAFQPHIKFGPRGVGRGQTSDWSDWLKKSAWKWALFRGALAPWRSISMGKQKNRCRLKCLDLSFETGLESIGGLVPALGPLSQVNLKPESQCEKNLGTFVWPPPSSDIYAPKNQK